MELCRTDRERYRYAKLLCEFYSPFPNSNVKNYTFPQGMLSRPKGALARNANFGKAGRPEPIIGKISQEILAEMVGTTRSRVSFFMNRFRKLGFIDYNGTIEVHSSLLSVVLSDPGRTVKTP